MYSYYIINEENKELFELGYEKFWKKIRLYTDRNYFTAHLIIEWGTWYGGITSVNKVLSNRLLDSFSSIIAISNTIFDWCKTKNWNIKIEEYENIKDTHKNYTITGTRYDDKDNIGKKNFGRE